ncbi:hypothetical protein OG206_00630 [Streptomyces sp. NBC_01341]|uniref:hypothetical protein n=1 Tax=Streptomyces sp. NBC_01341 TaxID=2903831 RepID=UPI002E0F9B3A|nr:hypothetical protein OG206_00630 [Streptomyces sp. NBC_01341]
MKQPMEAAMSGQAGARIASRARPSRIVMRSRSAHRSVPSLRVPVMLVATAC